MFYDLLKLSLTDQLDAEDVADVASQLVTNLVSECENVCIFHKLLSNRIPAKLFHLYLLISFRLSVERKSGALILSF